MEINMWNSYRRLLTYVMVFIAMLSCKPSPSTYQFELLTSDKTGVDFNNRLVQTTDDNIMTYLYFFNGGGVGCGDFNNDGLVDLYFAGNLTTNKIFLNQGKLTFKDVTTESSGQGESGWTTGISIVDINNDGMLDIYLSQVGGFKKFRGKNQLLVCQEIKNGIPKYRDEAAAYGLAFEGFSTQATFFDYDLDGDLDLFYLNHSVHENGTFGERVNFLGTSHPTSGDKLYRNDSGKFVDVTTCAGIHSMVIGYGLGIATSDINNDGWPDLYIGNDFHENDYLYINQGNGTFKEMLEEQMTHTSRFSMGVDIADINNDAWADVISLDMQPYDPVVLKRSLGEDEYNAFMFKLRYGYSVQFARNNVQLNNRNNTFSEIGMYADLFATDWSWASLILDFNHDGIKDVFITNGIPARMNDIDYVNFRAGDEDHQWKTKAAMMEMSDLEIIERIPSIKFPNQVFLGSGDLQFKKINSQIRNDADSYSNGAAYADLDNDGDLEVITNNINENAFIYKNLTIENNSAGTNYLKFDFSGPPGNRNAIGAKVMVVRSNDTIMYENFPVRGFQSCVDGSIHAGVGDTSTVRSAIVIWPDRTFQEIRPRFNTTIKASWKAGLPEFDFSSLKRKSHSSFNDITESVKLLFKHEENAFIEFDRERLIPFMVSTEGPGVAVGDVNGDGLEDVFFGNSKRKRAALFVQKSDGTFQAIASPVLYKDSVFEDVDATFVDFDQDDDLDLVVASGGNEYWGDSEYLKQRIYLNDGKGRFLERIFVPDVLATASCVLAGDFDGDGIQDLFIGGRATPKSYGVVPRSYLLKNSGAGKLTDVTSSHASELSDLGMITDGQWIDIDHDDDLDLVLAVEWGSVTLGINTNGKFEFQSISPQTGWWKFVLPGDFDGDGDIDIIAGNVGRNTKFKPSVQEPVSMYVNDFDDNGQVEQVLTYYVEGRELPFATHAEITKQIPPLKKKYLHAKDFAIATLEEIFGADKLRSSTKFEINTVDNAYFENVGNGEFKFHSLPFPFQLSTIRSGVILQEGSERNSTSVLLAGNFYENNIEMGRYNADYGNILLIGTQGKLQHKKNAPVHITGQVRTILPVQCRGNRCFLLARNNDTAILLQPTNLDSSQVTNY